MKGGLGARICRTGKFSLCQNRITTKTIIAMFHGQTTVFQSCPSGPREKRMKMCIPKASITATFLNLVSSPTPMPASTNGAAIASDRINPSEDAGSRATKGVRSQGKRFSTKFMLSF